MTHTEQDIAFLLGRAMAAGSFSCSRRRWTGLSSNALVEFAYTGLHNGTWPRDPSDFLACVRTVRRLPEHRRTPELFALLKEGKQRVRERWAS